MNNLTIRRPTFQFPDHLNLLPDATDKYYSALSCAITIVAPHIERYLIRTMRQAQQHIRCSELRQMVQDFSSQEANHFRNHDRLNAILRQQLSEDSRHILKKAETQLEEDYAKFGKSRSLKFNLAYAEGFEAATCALSLWSFQHKTTQTLDPEWRSLLDWHLAEEIEHRTVAFDLYHHLGGNYTHRLIWATYAQAHLLKYLIRFARCFLNEKEYQESASKRNILKKHQYSLMKGIASTLLPTYTPHKLTVSAEINSVLDQYS